MKIKNKKETFFLVLILLFSFLIRIWKLNQFPSVINGDETGSVIHPLEIILKKLTALFPALVFILFSASDFSIYWQWVKSPKFNSAQEPAIKIEEFQNWQKLQIEYLKKGRLPFSIYQWRNFSPEENSNNLFF